MSHKIVDFCSRAGGLHFAFVAQRRSTRPGSWTVFGFRRVVDAFDAHADRRDIDTARDALVEERTQRLARILLRTRQRRALVLCAGTTDASQILWYYHTSWRRLICGFVPTNFCRCRGGLISRLEENLRIPCDVWRLTAKIPLEPENPGLCPERGAGRRDGDAKICAGAGSYPCDRRWLDGRIGESQ